MLEMSGNASETKCVSTQRGKCIDIKLSTDRASLPVVLKTRNVHGDGRNKQQKEHNIFFRTIPSDNKSLSLASKVRRELLNNDNNSTEDRTRDGGSRLWVGIASEGWLIVVCINNVVY